jgi:hypothetical protein
MIRDCEVFSVGCRRSERRKNEAIKSLIASTVLAGGLLLGASTAPVLALAIEPNRLLAEQTDLKLAYGRSFADWMRDEVATRDRIAKNWTGYSGATRSR